MAGGYVYVATRDSGGNTIRVRFWSSNGELDDNTLLSAAPPLAPRAVDISGTITTGGAVQTFRAADSASRKLRLTNPATATEPLYYSDAEDSEGNHIPANPADPGCEFLDPGQTMTWPDGVAGEVTIYAATAAHAFIGRKG